MRRYFAEILAFSFLPWYNTVVGRRKSFSKKENKMKRILFQGDSITDAGRARDNDINLGVGYPYLVEATLKFENPNEYAVFNRGVSGNRIVDLYARIKSDFINLAPDYASILIGINDIWHRYGAGRIMTTDDQLILNYRTILTELKAKTNAKIMILSPYLLDCDDKDAMREDLNRVLPRISELAREFADVYVPLDEHFAKAIPLAPTKMYYSGDGVHPNANGAEFIGKLYAEAIEALL